MVGSYDELSLLQYDSVSKILNDESISDEDKDIRIVSILSGVGVDELLCMDAGDVRGMIKQAMFLAVPCVAEDVSEFDYGGYHFHVRNEINYGQYCDVIHASGSVELLHAILVPDGHDYNDGYDVDFSGIDFKTGWGILYFFVNGLRESVGAILKSSRPNMVKRIFSRRYRRMDSLIGSMVSLLSSGK